MDCPNGIAVGAENIWVLTQPDCSSANSRVVRINRAGRGEAITDMLGEWGQALALGFGKVFVAHVRPPGISVIDPVTLNATHAGSGELSLWAITANSFSVYAGGRFGDDNAAGVIVEINPADGSEGRRIPVPERIAAMTSDDTIVVAVGEKGTIWLVDVGSYRIVKTITVNGGIGNPRDVIISAGRIAITDQARNGDNGAVLILQNWQEIGAE